MYLPTSLPNTAILHGNHWQLLLQCTRALYAVCVMSGKTIASPDGMDLR